jgi:hypothetical protein
MEFEDKKKKFEDWLLTHGCESIKNLEIHQFSEFERGIKSKIPFAVLLPLLSKFLVGR